MTHASVAEVSDFDTLVVVYARVLVGSVRSLASGHPPAGSAGPTSAPRAMAPHDLTLAGPQTLWAQLDDRGYRAWANISLCVSVPSSRAPAAFLAAMAQALCDANDALRCHFVAGATGQPPTQRFHPTAQLPVHIDEAPMREQDALTRVLG